jgi:hypothetical protein
MTVYLHYGFILGMHRISGWSDNPAFFISGTVPIRPDTGFDLPDTRMPDNTGIYLKKTYLKTSYFFYDFIFYDKSKNVPVNVLLHLLFVYFIPVPVLNLVIYILSCKSDRISGQISTGIRCIPTHTGTGISLHCAFLFSGCGHESAFRI